jgi:hypothetical protein
MQSVAMSSTEHNLWTIANILGLVVVVAVAALLSLLIYLVKIIDRRVVAVRDTLKAAPGRRRPRCPNRPGPPRARAARACSTRSASPRRPSRTNFRHSGTAHTRT